jgi:hypothetical protein
MVTGLVLTEVNGNYGFRAIMLAVSHAVSKYLLQMAMYIDEYDNENALAIRI